MGYSFMKLFLKKNKEQDYFLDYVSRVALPGLLEGKTEYISILQGVFTIQEAEHYHMEVAKAYENLLSGSTVKQLIRLEENSRRHIDVEWNVPWWGIEWSHADMSREKFSHLNDAQYMAVLKLGTFHANGYYRQTCMEALSDGSQTLCYFVLRLNDWVKEIREAAFASACKRLETCDAQELFQAFPMCEKVKDSGRRRTEHIQAVEELMKSVMSDKLMEMSLSQVHTFDVTVKNSIYRFLNQNPILIQSDMEQLLLFEKENYGKKMLILGILQNYNCSKEVLSGYLQNKSTIIRYHALNYYYEKEHDAWNGLENLLLDRSGRIRDNVSYILEKHTDINIRDFYIKKFSQDSSRIAVLGIGEHGVDEDAALLSPLLDASDELLARDALKAYGMLVKEKGEDVYWRYLLYGRELSCIQAYRCITKYQIFYGAGILYHTYVKQRDQEFGQYLLNLLLREPSWKRLPYLLLLYDEKDFSEKQLNDIRKGIHSRHMYAKVSSDEAQNIRNILAEAGDKIPQEIKKGIESDLKYVCIEPLF